MSQTIKALNNVSEVAQVDVKILVRDAESTVTNKTLKRFVIKAAAREGTTHIQERGNKGDEQKLLNRGVTEGAGLSRDDPRARGVKKTIKVGHKGKEAVKSPQPKKTFVVLGADSQEAHMRSKVSVRADNKKINVLDFGLAPLLKKHDANNVWNGEEVPQELQQK